MLKGKVAVVTGSTSGIGLGIARALAAAGADLMINGFGEAAAIDKLRREIAATHGVRVAFNAADLSKPADATGLIEHAMREFGRVDVLVNNAGIQHVAPVHEFPLDRWDAVIAINLTAVFLTTRAVLPQMLARDWGRIINIAFVHGLVASIDKLRVRGIQAWRRRLYQRCGAGDGDHRHHLQCDLSRLGAHAAGIKANRRSCYLGEAGSRGSKSEAAR
jgi:3-hydroxybutyrate dehydrogenase